MYATDFKGANANFAKDQPQYHQLPAHYESNKVEGVVSTCWKLSFWERIRVLFTGRVWVQTMTFRNPLQPLRLAAKRPDLKNIPLSPQP